MKISEIMLLNDCIRKHKAEGGRVHNVHSPLPLPSSPSHLE